MPYYLTFWVRFSGVQRSDGKLPSFRVSSMIWRIFFFFCYSEQMSLSEVTCREHGSHVSYLGHTNAAKREFVTHYLRYGVHRVRGITFSRSATESLLFCTKSLVLHFLRDVVFNLYRGPAYPPARCSTIHFTRNQEVGLPMSRSAER